MGFNAETIDLNALNFCIQNHPIFANLPICCEIEHLRAHYHVPWKRGDDSGAVKVIVLYMSSDTIIRGEVISPEKSVFNTKHNTHRRLLGLG